MSANATLRIEITEEMMQRLLDGGQVCASDLNCLDCESKHCLWRLCLKSCARRHNGTCDGRRIPVLTNRRETQAVENAFS
jgi:hypothetical protein